MNDVFPLCQGRMVHWMTMPVDPKTGAPNAYGNLFRCANCSHGMVLPRPAPGEIGAFYPLDDYYTHGKSHFAESGAKTFADKVRFRLAWRMDFGLKFGPEMIDELLGKQASDICDMGCGSGELAFGLSALGHRVVGVEVDKVAIPEGAGEGKGGNLEFYEGSIENLPEALAGRRIDVVVISHVLDPLHAVSVVKSLLRPGGRFLCVVPNNACAGLAQTGQAWEPLDAPSAPQFIRARELADDLRGGRPRVASDFLDPVFPPIQQRLDQHRTT